MFDSWLLLVRGEVRRTGPRGVSLRATGAWELGLVHDLWSQDGVDAVRDLIARSPRPGDRLVDEPDERPRRVLVHASGFRQSPYADIKPAGADPARVPAATSASAPPAKLWHSSPGSSGW